MDIENDYWFTIEPYVFINIANNCALLYNTYDGKILISKKAKVIELLNTFLQKKDCGVILLKRDLYHNSDIFDFITDLRNKYMGDIIDISFSKGKPIQILPYYNLFRYYHITTLITKMNYTKYTIFHLIKVS